MITNRINYSSESDDTNAGTVTASIMKKKYVPIALNRHMYATDAVK